MLAALAPAMYAPLQAPLYAQMHHVDAPERVTRAVGVYEWTGELSKPTAARFVPVSLFIDGHFEDAGLYLPRPVPFALQYGDTYALEVAGTPQGMFDIDTAHRMAMAKVPNSEDAAGAPAGGWYGFGKFTPDAAPKHAAPLHASSHLTPIQSSAGPNSPAGTKETTETADKDNERPHMSRRSSSTNDPGTDKPSTDKSGTDASSGSQPQDKAPTSTDGNEGTKSSNGSTGGGSTTADSGDDTDRPTLRRRDPAQDAARHRGVGGKGNTSGVVAAGPAPGDDPDRPMLGRNNLENTGTPELNGMPADLHQAVAVSDATHRDTHAFARGWDSPAERAETMVALHALAKPRVAAYLAANGLVASGGPILEPAAEHPPAQLAGQDNAAARSTTTAATSPTPTTVPASPDDVEAGAAPRLQRGVPQAYKKPVTPSTTPAVTVAMPASPGTAAARPTVAGTDNPALPSTNRSTAAGVRSRTSPASIHGAPLTLGREDLVGYTLSYGGLPTFVYMAAAAAVAKPSNGTAAAAHPVVYVTVVVQRLASGEMQTALTAVTDSNHLDRSPRLRLIDAVDPDDSHRASLLFELRGNTGRQFALYRLTAATAEQTFTTASIE